MNINEFATELARRCRSLGIRINRDEIKIIINEFIYLIKEKVFEGHKVKIQNFGNFELGKTEKRALPNGERFDIKKVIRFKISRNFKNK